MLGFREKSFEKRNHSVAKFACASKPFQRNITGKRFKQLKVLIIIIFSKHLSSEATNQTPGQRMQELKSDVDAMR